MFRKVRNAVMYVLTFVSIACFAVIACLDPSDATPISTILGTYSVLGLSCGVSAALAWLLYTVEKKDKQWDEYVANRRYRNSRSW